MNKEKVKHNIKKTIEWLKATEQVAFYPVGLLNDALKEFED